MAEAHPFWFSLSQEQIVLGKVIYSIAENGGKSLSSEDFGIIKHIISPEDFQILRRNFGVTRIFYNGDDKNLPFSLMQFFSDIPSIIDVEGDRLSREYKYEDLLGFIENIFHHAHFNDKSASQENLRVSNEKINQDLRSIEGLQIDSNIQRTIYELYWKMISGCACGVDDAHEVTVALLDSLHDYSWAAQVVLLVAAFAISFGEFWQTVEPPSTTEEDHQSRSICLLKRPHCLMQVTDSMKSGLESIKTLVERIWELTKWLVEFEKEFATSWYATYRKSNAAIEYPEVLVIGYQVVYSVVVETQP
ncbi:protein SIEVE ELEMENT OCCLUSION B-like [Macadamia integrifolia]|uniref:protein SIEVE ELEMENT OCCLUSION B-like n=1 Tax=Macadamia integrifolia TaxID=60698 RepID=UPI001C52E7F5|nr:protein SIEVE ELEMENT OCCLUSION B-like [Macadamia integrifolia]